MCCEFDDAIQRAADFRSSSLLVCTTPAAGGSPRATRLRIKQSGAYISGELTFFRTADSRTPEPHFPTVRSVTGQTTMSAMFATKNSMHSTAIKPELGPTSDGICISVALQSELMVSFLQCSFDGVLVPASVQSRTSVMCYAPQARSRLTLVALVFEGVHILRHVTFRRYAPRKVSGP